MSEPGDHKPPRSGPRLPHPEPGPEKPPGSGPDPPSDPGPVKPPQLDPDLETACRRHLDFVRKNCPGMLPSAPLDPGTPVDLLPFDDKAATALLRTAVKSAVAAGNQPPPDVAVWIDGTDSLLVFLDSVNVATSDGVVTVSVLVSCDQLMAAIQEPRATISVDLAVGTKDRPTGLLAAATTPRGPPVVVDRWHDQLVALAWRALLDMAAAMSATAGTDTDGNGLVPTRWVATTEGLAIGPQARHPFDRMTATSRRADLPR